MTPELKPSLTLRDVVGPGHRLLFRASARRCRWFAAGRLRDAVATGGLTVAGALPYLVATAGYTPRVRSLYQRAGIRIEALVETYSESDDYAARLSEFTAPGRVVVQHILPEDELEAERYWIPPALLSWLNNKGNLAELVPASAVPDRRRIDAGGIAGVRLPCVVKAVTDDSTGGGRDVVICRTAGDVEEARARFDGLAQVVVEELLEVEANYCVNFAVFPGGEVRDLGAAGQVSAADGKFEGNWVDPAAKPPEQAVAAARHAVARAGTLGYYGFAGVDVLVTPDGRSFVIDLNFRFNASTTALLYADAIRARYGDVVIRARRWMPSSDRWQADLERGIDEGKLIPSFLYDPDPESGQGPFISILALGRDRGEIERFLASIDG